MATELNSAYLKEYSLAETKRHKPCLIYRGHRYVQDKIQNRTIYWRCEDRSHCNGRAHQLISNGSLPILTIKHNHPAIVEDLSKHDIVSVDSHRRRQRQNRKISYRHSNTNDDFLFPTTSPTMTSSVKLENHQNKQQRFQQQDSATVRNLHLSEVITTGMPPNTHHYNSNNTYRHTTMNPVEMSKLINNITKASTSSSIKTVSATPKVDYSSRLNHFSWEELEGRYLPVIYRYENGVNQRYISKMYVENTLFQSESWQRHAVLARSLPPLVSYSYTDPELKLFRFIIEWHLASFHFKTIPSSDCLICFEDLLDFYNNLRKLRDTASTPTYNRPIAPLPRPSPVPFKPDIQSQSFVVPTQILSSIKQQSKQNLLPQNAELSLEANRQQEQSSSISTQKNAKECGWVQINNVFVPYIIKIKLRENELNKCHTRQPTPQLQREFYVPYEILIKCNIFSDDEFVLKKLLIKATQQDFDILNTLITNINIFDEKVPEKTLLVNLYHVMVGLNRIFYIKFLPTKQPRTQVNKYHSDILTQKGGTLLMNGNKLIPYIVQNNRFYVPLLYAFNSLPNILLQAKRGARAPRQYEIDFLNLLFIYFSIDTLPLTSDTLLVDIFNIKCSNLQSVVHFRTLSDHQQYEKNKLLNTIMRNQQSHKSTNASSTTHKTNKYPLANVVVNPMIHHPSFYGLTTSKAVPSLPKPGKQGEIKTIMYDNHTLNAIVKSPDTPISDWKVSLKEIFQKFSFDIDYQKFVQWCQTNLLLSLVKLDDEENQIIKNTSTNDDYYMYQRNLDRCIELLNDLKRGIISMTLLPPSPSNELQSQHLMVKSPLAGAKKRKTTTPTTRHVSPVPTPDEPDILVNAISKETEYIPPELPVPEPVVPSEHDEVSVKSPHDEITFTIVHDDDGDNNSDHYNNNDANSVANVDVDDDDDRMPVVASVEEEQPIDDTIQPYSDPTFVIVDTADGSDERIHLDDALPSCSSGYESSTALTNGDNNIHQDDDETNSIIYPREHLSSSPASMSQKKSATISSKRQKKDNDKRPYNNSGESRSRSRSRSLTPRNIKKQCSNHDQSSSVTIITKDKIEQHLRTLFMASNESRRTRTRSIKTPTRLVEEININNIPMNVVEPDTNVFDILSSSIATETIDNGDNAQNNGSLCTYNVVITDKPNKLGLTIKKVAPS